LCRVGKAKPACHDFGKVSLKADCLVTRYGRGWFGIRANDLTAALVGIAGFGNQQISSAGGAPF
jgi:hypothetical protein